jgi:hypothetical protein
VRRPLGIFDPARVEDTHDQPPTGGSLVAWKRGHLASELSRARRAVDALGGGDLEVIDVGLKGLDGHRLVVATRAPGGSIPDRFPRDPAQRTRAPW